MVFKKIIFQNSLMANETPSRPPPLHGKCHLKFPFWFSAYLPNWNHITSKTYHQGHPNLSAYYVSWKPNQMAVYIDLQAELTIVSSSQTKPLNPCFQYQFDIQYSSTPGGHCWGSDFLRLSSHLFSPLPLTKPVLFIPDPGSQNQMFGLASVHNG